MDRIKWITLWSLLGILACGDDSGGGTLTVAIEAEDSITSGLDPGAEVENIQDGWQVRFESYIAVLGDIHLNFATDATTEAHAEQLYAVDLTSVPQNGLALWTVPALKAGDWNFSYALGDGSLAEPHASVSEEAFAQISEQDLTYMITGTLSKTDGESCPPNSLAEPGSATPVGTNAGGDHCYTNAAVKFSISLNAETHYTFCGLDDAKSFNMPTAGTQHVAITIHGDHMFFNGFPEGDEGGTLRLAQWLADCDLNLDGQVDMDELAQIAPADLSELDDRYQLGGSSIELDTMQDYVKAQLKTQGHIQGEGECAIDGQSHHH